MTSLRSKTLPFKITSVVSREQCLKVKDRKVLKAPASDAVAYPWSQHSFTRSEVFPQGLIRMLSGLRIVLECCAEDTDKWSRTALV